MSLKREHVIVLLILSFIFFILAHNIYAIGAGGGFITGEITPVEPGTQVFNPSGLTQANPVEGIINPSDGVSSIPSVGEGASLQTSSGLVSNIAGSYHLITMSGQIAEGVIISSKNNNVVPALNLLEGSLIFYHMQLGDKVIIDQIGGDGVMGSKYNAQMDKGVSADISKDLGKVRFTAYGDDSILKISRPEGQPKYEFNNGLLEYENKNVLEQVNTTKLNDASVDKNYETGFKCLTLAADANYNYDDKVSKERSFSIKNLNNQDYKVCVKKTIYDEYQMVNNRYSLVDLVKDSVKFKAKVLYSKKNKPVYESFDERNDAEMETSLGVTKLLVQNRAPSSETVAKTYTGNHVITEKLQGKDVVRLHEFSKEKYPELINIYSTMFRSEQPDISINDNMLVQDGKNRFAAFTNGHSCASQLKALFDYGEDESFYDEC